MTTQSSKPAKPPIAPPDPEDDSEPSVVTHLLDEMKSTMERAGESLEQATAAAQAMLRQARRGNSIMKLKTSTIPPKGSDK